MRTDERYRACVRPGQQRLSMLDTAPTTPFNPRVPGSIPGRPTLRTPADLHLRISQDRPTVYSGLVCAHCVLRGRNRAGKKSAGPPTPGADGHPMWATGPDGRRIGWARRSVVPNHNRELRTAMPPRL